MTRRSAPLPRRRPAWPRSSNNPVFGLFAPTAPRVRHLAVRGAAASSSTWTLATGCADGNPFVDLTNGVLGIGLHATHGPRRGWVNRLTTRQGGDIHWPATRVAEAGVTILQTLVVLPEALVGQTADENSSSDVAIEPAPAGQATEVALLVTTPSVAYSLAAAHGTTSGNICTRLPLSSGEMLWVVRRTIDSPGLGALDQPPGGLVVHQPPSPGAAPDSPRAAFIVDPDGGVVICEFAGQYAAIPQPAEPPSRQP